MANVIDRLQDYNPAVLHGLAQQEYRILKVQAALSTRQKRGPVC